MKPEFWVLCCAALFCATNAKTFRYFIDDKGNILNDGNNNESDSSLERGNEVSDEEKVIWRSKQFQDNTTDKCKKDSDCENEGKCVETLCDCKEGTLGDKCETIQACEIGKYKDCKDEKGKCTFAEGSAKCECSENKVLDENAGYCKEKCDETEVCENEGECVDDVCNCKNGTTGDKCETVTDCVSGKYKDCKGERGECIFMDGSAKCDCDTAKALDKKAGYCKEKCDEDNSCENEGECVDNICNCKNGTTGDKCDTITDCESGKYKDCKGERGTCTFIKGSAKCECSGDKVLNEEVGYCKDPCEGVVCENGGTCKKGKCDCLPKTSGNRCEKIDCSDIGCKATGGECKYNVSKKEPFCQCPGDQILHSKIKKCVDPCSSDATCENNGKCKDKECQCEDKTHGIKCENAICTEVSPKCDESGGKCKYNKTESKPFCMCPRNKIFNNESRQCEDTKCKKQCGVEADEKGGDVLCEEEGSQITCKCKDNKLKFDKSDKKCKKPCSDKCENNGVCSGENEDKFCKCKGGTSGDLCEVVDDCQKKDFCGKVKEGVVCVYDEENEKGKCVCTGDKVFDLSTNKCRTVCSNNCQNNGVCKGEETKFCECKEGTSGDLCEIVNDCKKKDFCGKQTKDVKCVYDEENKKGKCECIDRDKEFHPNAKECRYTCDDDCENGGICKEVGNLKFCECLEGTTGDTCEEITACKSGKYKDCKDNKGSCDFDIETKTAVCSCPAKKKLDPTLNYCRRTCAAKKDCQNGAKCQDPDRGGVKFCACPVGTEGDMCDFVKDCQDQNGKLRNCKDEKGKCIFDPKEKKAKCECESDQTFDEIAGHCQDSCTKDSDCSDGKKCNEKQFCACEEGYGGEKCKEILGCKKIEKDCEKANADCVFDAEEKDKAACKCKDDRFIYDKAKKICAAKFCKENFCGKENCTFDENIDAIFCECPEGKYFNYEDRKCADPDKCLLKKTPCKKNEICKNGACECPFEKSEEGCVRKLCDPNPCFKKATCDEKTGSVKCTCEGEQFYDGSSCSDKTCILKDFKECNCPSGMKKDESGKCVPTASGSKLCDDDCGYGYCVQANDKSSCKCVASARIERGKCVLSAIKLCASKALTSDLTKCNCTGQYKQAENGITCDLKTCDDESVQKECKAKGATCVMNWATTANTPVGYSCKCPRGYVMDTVKQICTDACNVEKVMRSCLKTDQFCYNSVSNLNIETSDCQCPPPLTMVDNRCYGIGENFYIFHNIPVLKEKYIVNNKVDYVLLNSHLIQSMKQTFVYFDYGYLRDYKVKGNIISCSVWIKFKESPSSELKRIKLQTTSFNCADCDNTLSVWPPFVLLSAGNLDDIKIEELKFCSDVTKNVLCGKDAHCENNKCSCKPGYKTIEYSVRDSGVFRIERCEDIDECTEGTHICSKNTTCINTPGGYYCQCLPKYKKLKDSVLSKTIQDKEDCFDLCTPNPCKKGKCVLQDGIFDCRCDPGVGGPFCSRPDVNFASAKKSTVVVGAVLGTILGLIVLASILYYVRLRKNSYSEDFMPAPRQDHPAEMMERRPIRGVVNKSYE